MEKLLYFTDRILSDAASHNTGRLMQSPSSLTLNEACGKDCKDFCVIHLSGSTDSSVSNTWHTARQQLALSDVWHKPKGQIRHLMLSYNRNPSHVCHPCQKLGKWLFPWVTPASSTGIDRRPSLRGFFSPATAVVVGGQLQWACWETCRGHPEVNRKKVLYIF